MAKLSKLVQVYRAFTYDVGATAFFAAEPVCTSDAHGGYAYYEQPAWRVWLHRNLPTFVTAGAYVAQGMAMLVCRMRGHMWVDAGYGGPESGCVDMHCTRCGYSHHVTLY